MQKPYIQESYKKEFIIAMQAKGKLPRVITDASERYEEAYHDTCPRIFPGPGGMDTVLQQMLIKSEKRINAAQKHNGDPTLAAAHAILHATATTAASHLVQQAALGSHEDKTEMHRQEVKAHLHHTDRQLQYERQQRLMSQAKLAKGAEQLRSQQVTLGRGRQGHLTGGTLQERMQAEGKLPLYPSQVAASQPVHAQPVTMQPFTVTAAALPEQAPQQGAAQAAMALEDRLLAAQQASRKAEMRTHMLEREAELLRAVQQEKVERREAEKRLATMKYTIVQSQ